MQHNYSQKQKNGFTLIELLVVISLIGFLAGFVVASLGEARQRGQISAAKEELFQLNTAIEALATDTNVYPSNTAPHRTDACDSAVQPDEGFINQPDVGLVATDGTYPGWRGPYISPPPRDPWGTYYYIDPDFHCGIDVNGCHSVGTPDYVVQSFGPNKTQDYGTTPGSDDIVYVLCDRQ